MLFSLFYRAGLLIVALGITILLAPSNGFGQERKKGFIGRMLDRALQRSGVDPKSKDAENAKSLGKTWMNPLSTEKDINRELNRVKRQFEPQGGSRSTSRGSEVRNDLAAIRSQFSGLTIGICRDSGRRESDKRARKMLAKLKAGELSVHIIGCNGPEMERQGVAGIVLYKSGYENHARQIANLLSSVEYLSVKLCGYYKRKGFLWCSHLYKNVVMINPR